MAASKGARKEKAEYQRLKKLFEGCDPGKLELVDNLLKQTAEIYVECCTLKEATEKAGGRIIFTERGFQRVPKSVAELDKLRKRYSDNIYRLCNILDRSVVEEIEDDLNEFY